MVLETNTWRLGVDLVAVLGREDLPDSGFGSASLPISARRRILA
jgi:hypothetical protein